MLAAVKDKPFGWPRKARPSLTATRHDGAVRLRSGRKNGSAGVKQKNGREGRFHAKILSSRYARATINFPGTKNRNNRGFPHQIPWWCLLWNPSANEATMAATAGFTSPRKIGFFYCNLEDKECHSEHTRAAHHRSSDAGGLGRPIGVPTARFPERWSNPKNWNFWTSAPQKNTEISPLFECDSATRAFYGLKNGKITVNFSGSEQNRVVLKGGL